MTSRLGTGKSIHFFYSLYSVPDLYSPDVLSCLSPSPCPPVPVLPIASVRIRTACFGQYSIQCSTRTSSAMSCGGMYSSCHVLVPLTCFFICQTLICPVLFCFFSLSVDSLCGKERLPYTPDQVFFDI